MPFIYFYIKILIINLIQDVFFIFFVEPKLSLLSRLVLVAQKPKVISAAKLTKSEALTKYHAVAAKLINGVLKIYNKN